MSDDIKAAAEQRKAFFEAAGIKPGTLITQRTIVHVPSSTLLPELWASRDGSMAGPNAMDRGILAGGIPAKVADMTMRSVMHMGKSRYEFNGVASVVDQPYEMWDFLGPYTETVAREAFTETLASGPDVAFLENHRGLTMARTMNNSLTLGMDAAGMTSRAFCNPERDDVQRCYHGVNDRDVTEMSFAFMIDEGEWSEDYDEFRILKLNMNRGDTSVVNYGANPYTTIGVRTNQILKDIRQLPPPAALKAMEILSGRTDVARLERRIEAEELVEAERTAASCEPRKRGRSITSVEALLTLGEE